MHPHRSRAGRAGPTLPLGQASVSGAWGSGRPPHPAGARGRHALEKGRAHGEAQDRSSREQVRPRQEGRPRGTRHRELRRAREGPPGRLHAAPRPEGDAARDHRGQAVHRGRTLPRAGPHARRGPAHRRRRERRERLPRPRRLTRPRHLPHLERQREEPDRGAGRPGRHEVEEGGARSSSG